MKNQIEDKEKLGTKLSEEDQSTIKDALKDTQNWMSANTNAEKEDYEEELKELEAICNPIIQKAYPKGGSKSSH